MRGSRARVAGGMKLLHYVALGDSTAVGVGAGGDGGYPARLRRRLEASGRPVALRNLGRSGATSGDLLPGLAGRAAAGEPALVTLGIGTNDLWRLVPVERFAANLEAVADRLEATGAAVVCCNVVDLAHAPIARMCEAMLGIPATALSERARALNAHVAALARRPRFTVVDLHALGDELPRHPEYFSADGFHPSAAGYERWADLMWPAVEAAISGPR
jgi:lysophospholipase L1-like esterase